MSLVGGESCLTRKSTAFKAPTEPSSIESDHEDHQDFLGFNKLIVGPPKAFTLVSTRSFQLFDTADTDVARFT